MPISVWHDKPLRYEMPVKDGQEIVLEIEQQCHKYTENELKNVILKVNSNNNYIQDNIHGIIKDLEKYFPSVDEITYQKQKAQETSQRILTDLTTYRLDIKNFGQKENAL